MSVFKTKAVRWLLLAAGLAVVAALATQEAGLTGVANRFINFFRVAGPLPFFLAMALLPMVGFPLSPFTFVAGPVFGPTLGVGNVIACAILAVAANVALSYWIADRALRPLVTRLAGRLGYTIPTLPTDAARDVSLLVRIIPGPPFFLQSYLLGLARVPFGTYMAVSTLIPAVYMTGAILAGDALMRGDRGALIVAGVLSLAAGFAAYRLRKRFTAAPRAV